MLRGEVWWADLGEPRGTEPAFRRPIVVVQHDRLTASTLSTVMVVPLTSNLGRADAKGNVLLRREETGLPKDSVALACQVITADKLWLAEHVGSLSPRAQRKLDEGLTLTLDLA
ncbi:MAG: type II toxin-antitoxin system PemK/MazF family toxin [Deltaproteobacteria bacterium]|nr:type II toxin-antitoxin system PemK/MazF family toxin [Deltaproteobacteria bacterium]